MPQLPLPARQNNTFSGVEVILSHPTGTTPVNRLTEILVVATLLIACVARADEPATLKNFKAPSKNSKDEPLAAKLTLQKAGEFLDSAALGWTKSHGCFSCHSNLSYLYARPHLPGPAPAHADVRLALEELVSKRWPEKGPRWDTEVVVAAAALACNDSLTTRKLHPLTRTALDRMWTVQRKDGGFSWYKCNLPPMEIDDHYGATLAAVATGVAPERYAKTEAARKGLDGLRAYLKANPPQNLHHKAMTLWAASYVEDFWTDDGKKEAVKELLAAQLPDGGWSAASLGAWKRADKLEQDPKTSDGYGTGFVTFALRRAGVPTDDPALQKAVAWLRANQRASGRWFTRSLARDDTHYLTDAGSAFAVMALAACEEKGTSVGAR
jgi:squalene-hopene/tetraprenyl-beta-curcumene cyclase